MGASWKTTVLAIITIVTLIGSVITNIITGLPVQWEIVIPALITAIGLLFAKDSNVTGGDKSNGLTPSK